MIQNSIRSKLYFLLTIVTLLFLLLAVENYLGNLFSVQIDKNLQIHAVGHQLTHLQLEEPEALLNKDRLQRLLSGYNELDTSSCVSCHSRKTELIRQRISLLGDLNGQTIAVTPVRLRIQQVLEEMMANGRYIHELHATNLKNAIDENNTLRPVVHFKKGQFKKHPMFAASEIDILEQVVIIQQSLADIYSSFFMLQSINPDLKEIRERFKKDIATFHTAVNTFETYSLDAQDGLLTEDLLNSGRFFQHSLEFLLGMAKKYQHLSHGLSENRQQLTVAFNRVNKIITSRINRLKRQETLLRIFVSLFLIILAAMTLFNFRGVLKTINVLTTEAQIIKDDFTHRIQSAPDSAMEFRLLADSLNSLADGISQEMQQVYKAKREWERTFDTIPDLIMLMDTDHRITQVNRALSDKLQIPPEKLIGKTCYHILYDNVKKPPSSCPLSKIRSGDQQSRHAEFHNFSFGGYMAITASPLTSSDGSLIGSVCVLRDINIEKNLEFHIEEYLCYLETILQSTLNTVIIATDRQMRIRFFNKAAESFLGISANMVMGHDMKEFHKQLAPTTLQRFTENLRQVFQGKSIVFPMEYKNRCLDTRVSPIIDWEGKLLGVLLIGRDITEQKQAEKEREEIYQKLVRAEKMEAIGMVAGEVAHDLNNILSGIINYPELLLWELPSHTRMRKPLEDIKQAGQRAAAIVSDLLTVTRGVAKERKKLSLNNIITNYVNSLEFPANSKNYPAIRYSTNLEPDLWPVHGSEIHIQKILMNLVTNAFEAVEGTGEVILTTENRINYSPKDKTRSTTDNYVALKIADTGPGISREEQQHIFEPFYSKKIMGRSGTGLGLTVAKNCALEHGGTIELQSDNTGTIFTVLFPATDEKFTGLEKTGLHEQPLQQGQGSLILVVDDEALQRDVVSKMLTLLGYQVHTASSGEEAITYLHSHDVELVILDMRMDPGMNGLQTYQKIISFKPDQRTIIASGFSEDKAVKKALRMGLVGLLKKPYSMKKLGKIVANALEKEERS
jgi:PAS domain S-box-containing protein